MDDIVSVDATVFGLICGAAVGFCGTTAILCRAIVKLKKQSR